MRAVLVDAETRHIERVVDWKVDGNGQYLWQAGPGRVLVHINGRLHLMGADLKDFAVFPADGDLQWVTTSASGKRLAVGIVQERHDKDTHEQIEQLSGKEPEEDVKVLLIDEAGNTTLRRTQTSTTLPPVLTDESEFAIGAAGESRWKLLKKTEDGSSARTLVLLESQCLPRLSAPLANTLFVTGCDAEGARWYRVLSEDGHTLLKSRPSMLEVEDSIAAGGDGEFAIRVVKLANGKLKTTTLELSELRSEQIQVYRQRDGKPLFAIAESKYPVSRENYALSTDGERLAVMTKAEVEIFSINAQGAKPESATTVANAAPR